MSSKKGIPHDHDPLYHLYNEYINIPKSKKDIFKDHTTNLETKIIKYKKLEHRQQELKEQLRQALPNDKL